MQALRGKKEHGTARELHVVQYYWNEKGIERTKAKRDKAMRGHYSSCLWFWMLSKDFLKETTE